MKQSRVLWVTKGLGRGGTEQLLVDTARLLDRDRWAVEVAYLIPAKDALVPALERLDVPVHCLDGRKASSIGWMPRLRNLVRDGAFDIVHTHMPYPAVISRLVIRQPPYIVHTEHNVWDRYRRPTYWANALTYQRNAAVIAVSHGVADSIDASRVPGHRPLPPIEVIVHGVNLASYRPQASLRLAARDRIGVAPDAPLLGSVGNFTAKKDHHTMLEAVARLHRERPALKLALIGSGPLEEALRHQARRLGLGQSVRFLGSRDDVAELLPGLDLFVLSSRHEGLSIALLEALATGIPAVATRVGGIPEVLQDRKQGLLVPAGNPAAMARAIGSLLDDGEMREAMGSAGVKRASEFDLASAVRQLETVYEKVLSR